MAVYSRSEAGGGPIPILLILSTDHGQLGGTERDTVRLAQELGRQGFQPIIVEVGLPILDEFIDTPGPTLRYLPAKRFSDVSQREWKALLKEYRPSIVIRSKCWVGCINWRLDIAVRRFGAVYLGWEQHLADDPHFAVTRATKPTLASRLRYALRMRLHARAVRRSVAISTAVRDPLVRFYPFRSDRVDVIYPGVDFQEFTFDPIARQEMRRAWHIPQDSYVIGSLGRLVPHKGNDVLLRLFAAIRQRNPTRDLWCVIAGRGPDLPRLQAMASELGIDERVRFPGWQESAPRAWSAIDLFIMPSLEEGLGLALIEAIACGCLAFSAALGGMREVLFGPLEEYALPPGDDEAWLAAVESVLAMSTQERALRQQEAYRAVYNRFNADSQWTAMVDWVRLHSG